MAEVTFDRLNKVYPDGYRAVNDVNLDIRDGEFMVLVGPPRIHLSESCMASRAGLRAYTGREIVLGIRPENLEDAAVASPAEQGDTRQGEVVLREALGSEIMAHVAIEGRPAETDETRELAEDVGAPEGGEQEIGVAEGKTILVGRFNARSRVKEGDLPEVAVEAGALHFFDPETGAGIYAETNGAALSTAV